MKPAITCSLSHCKKIEATQDPSYPQACHKNSDHHCRSNASKEIVIIDFSKQEATKTGNSINKGQSIRGQSTSCLSYANQISSGRQQVKRARARFHRESHSAAVIASSSPITQHGNTVPHQHAPPAYFPNCNNSNKKAGINSTIQKGSVRTVTQSNQSSSMIDNFASPSKIQKAVCDESL